MEPHIVINLVSDGIIICLNIWFTIVLEHRQFGHFICICNITEHMKKHTKTSQYVLGIKEIIIKCLSNQTPKQS